MPIVEFVLKRLIRKGSLQIIGANGSIQEFGGNADGPQVTVKFHDPALLFKLAQDFTLHLGEAYMDGRLTIEKGTLYDLLELFAINYHDAPAMPWEVAGGVFDPIWRLFKPNDPKNALKNVAHHYDISPDLFKLFLDPDLQYSCGYFTKAENTLAEAQYDKKRLIASKLLLKPGMRVFEIGCGYGGLAIYLAKNYGVEVTAITLSQEQLKIAVERAKQEGVDHLCKFRLQDYREEKGTYDRVVSIAMFEAVGLAHFPEFFGQVKALLKDDGVAFLHSIGRMDGPGTSDSFLLKYIFPGGYAPALSEVLPVIEKSGLWATDIEILRMHYARTLECWRQNFDRNREKAAQMYDERFCRMWEFYLTGAEMDFRYLSTMIFHIQMCKDINAVPLTREYMVKEFDKQKPYDPATAGGARAGEPAGVAQKAFASVG
jgi:cyclopropane-fatty-acyl-phospholipid synthase